MNFHQNLLKIVIIDDELHKKMLITEKIIKEIQKGRFFLHIL